LSVDKEKKKIALSIKRAEVDPWTLVANRYKPGQIVTGTITKIAPFGAFARIEDGVEGLIHSSELTPGMDPKTSLHEGQELQLRILRIEADRRRLGLSLRQAEEPDVKGAETETALPDSGTTHTPDDMISLEEISSRAESQGEKEGGAPRQNRAERRSDKPNEAALLGGLGNNEGAGETTAMAEAFRAAARQRSKEESEGSSE
jgi:small subunit ribosomal protein S1